MSDSLLGLFFAYAQMERIKKGSKYFSGGKILSEQRTGAQALIWYYTEINIWKRRFMFEKVEKSGTDNPETLRNPGIAYERIGDYDNAQQCFITACA